MQEEYQDSRDAVKSASSEYYHVLLSSSDTLKLPLSREIIAEGNVLTQAHKDSFVSSMYL